MLKNLARVPNSATLYTNFQRACTRGLPPSNIFFNCYILVQRGSLHILRVSSHSYDKICILSHPPNIKSLGGVAPDATMPLPRMSLKGIIYNIIVIGITLYKNV